MEIGDVGEIGEAGDLDACGMGTREGTANIDMGLWRYAIGHYAWACLTQRDPTNTRECTGWRNKKM